jgi:hypothetical protein
MRLGPKDFRLQGRMQPRWTQKGFWPRHTAAISAEFCFCSWQLRSADCQLQIQNSAEMATAWRGEKNYARSRAQIGGPGHARVHRMRELTPCWTLLVAGASRGCRSPQELFVRRCCVHTSWMRQLNLTRPCEDARCRGPPSCVRERKRCVQRQRGCLRP